MQHTGNHIRDEACQDGHPPAESEAAEPAPRYTLCSPNRLSAQCSTPHPGGRKRGRHARTKHARNRRIMSFSPSSPPACTTAATTRWPLSQSPDCERRLALLQLRPRSPQLWLSWFPTAPGPAPWLALLSALLSAVGSAPSAALGSAPAPSRPSGVVLFPCSPAGSAAGSVLPVRSSLRLLGCSWQ